MLGEIIGSYSIVEKLGEGGMGVVYSARHASLDRLAVIKVLHRHLCDSEIIAERFINEAHAAASIQHPGIVAVMDVGRHTSDQLYIVMEHLVGEDLANRLLRVGALPWPTAVSFILQAARALAAVHARGIIHRDLKPDNMFLVADPDVPVGERVKLLDFGIAKLTESRGDTGLTETGTLVGSPPYMSPEQCFGDSNIDVRTDLYALGIILFEIVAGRRPFQKQSHGEYILAHVHEAPPWLSHINPAAPEGLSQITAQLLAKNRDDRFASATALIAALEAVSAGQPHQWSTPTPAGAHTPTPPTAGYQAYGDPRTFVGNQTRVAPTFTSQRGLVIAVSVVMAIAAGVGVWTLLRRPTATSEIPADAATAISSDSPQNPPPEPLREAHVALADLGDGAIRLLEVPAQSFTMGSPGSEPNRAEDEGPRRTIRLSRYQIGAREITQKQWETVMGANPSDCGFGCGDDLPVQNVSWNLAIEFLNRLSTRETLTPCYEIDGAQVTWIPTCDGYRLPTEAEWEMAARAGTHTAYSFGDDSAGLDRHAWHGGAGGTGGKTVHPVATLAANPWGLYDVHGNVWEWVWDRFGLYQAVSDPDPRGPQRGADRVLRGGCFLSRREELRSPYRTHMDPQVSYEYIGLRVARSAP